MCTVLSRTLILRQLQISKALRQSVRSAAGFSIQRLDHFVITVKDIEKTCDFYSKVLGMKVTTFKGGRKALEFGNQKINIHQHGREFEPKADTPTPGSADVCFITDAKLPEVLDHVQKCGVTVTEGPVERTGAVGPILSIYFRDPDNNLIEVEFSLGHRFGFKHSSYMQKAKGSNRDHNML